MRQKCIILLCRSRLYAPERLRARRTEKKKIIRMLDAMDEVVATSVHQIVNGYFVISKLVASGKSVYSVDLYVEGTTVPMVIKYKFRRSRSLRE